MNTVKIDSKKTLMVAHRGLSGLEPENSIPAFVAAGNRSYFGIETDVHVTTDGRFICFHDEQTARVAGDDINVETSSYHLVRKIVLDNICGVEAKTGEKVGDLKGRDDLLIPRLEDYINICKKYEKIAVLEVKNRMETGDLKKLVEEIKALGYLEHVIFISFSLENMIDLRKMLPNQKLQYLTTKYNEEIHRALTEYQLDWDAWYPALTKEIIDKLHAEGIVINTWTVDSKEDAEKFASWGVDFITSNILEQQV